MTYNFLILNLIFLSVTTGAFPIQIPTLSTFSLKTDVILSSGFLAFARHAGFIDACVDAQFKPAKIVGTSSGSLAGSLWASGLTSDQISHELSARPPISLIRVGRRMHRGLLSVRGLIKHMRTIVPKDFDQLQTPLAVGVINSKGIFELISSGDLPEAVAASCAIPYIFQPVLTGTPPSFFADGGVKDRLGLTDWSNWSSSEAAVVHLVGSSRLITQDEENALRAPQGKSLLVVNTPKAKATFFSLKDYTAQKDEAYRLSLKVFYKNTLSKRSF